MIAKLTRQIPGLLLSMVLLEPALSLSYFDREDFKVVAGVQSQSLLTKRGIITYEGFQATPIVAVQLFHPDWLATASALYFSHNLSEHWILRGVLNGNATTDRPLFITSEGEADRVRRPKTTELDVYVEYRLENQSFVRWQYSQDLQAHKGYHTELVGRLSLFDWKPRKTGNLSIQPGLFASLGLGNSAHNQYLYGQGANPTGLNFVEYGVWTASPESIDVFWPTLKVSHFQILGNGNANASYVQEQAGWQASLLVAFKVF